MPRTDPREHPLDDAAERRRRIAEYQDRYAAEYGFEAVMVAARQRLILEIMARLRPRVVLEAGCGIELLAQRVGHADLPVEQWIIVEPAERFARAARARETAETRIDVIRGFFEDSIAAVRQRSIRPPDFILCSGLLNEVEEPERILRAARELLAPSGVVHVNVPNALSLHRRLAKAMGIIEDEKQLTERNRRLMQYRVYTPDSLLALAAASGFRVVDSGGYFVKPFTHAQMESLGELLSGEMLDGLWQLGRELPELASEIYVNLQAA